MFSQDFAKLLGPNPPPDPQNGFETPALASPWIHFRSVTSYPKIWKWAIYGRGLREVVNLLGHFNILTACPLPLNIFLGLKFCSASEPDSLPAQLSKFCARPVFTGLPPPAFSCWLPFFFHFMCLDMAFSSPASSLSCFSCLHGLHTSVCVWAFRLSPVPPLALTTSLSEFSAAAW